MTDERTYLENLAERLAAGDARAFAEFADHFGERFYRYFHYRCRIPDADAQDLSGDCVTDFALRAKKYSHRGGGSFGAWVYRAMRNAAVSWIRAHAEVRIPVDEGVSGGYEASVAIDGQVLAAVREAMDSLGTLDREVVEARCRGYVALEFEEIAADWNAANHASLTASGLRVRHFRALEKLEKILRADPRMAKRISRAQSGTESR
jgi:DNA-directed RNA polymerase specialized sigma24 family protein